MMGRDNGKTKQEFSTYRIEPVLNSYLSPPHRFPGLFNLKLKPETILRILINFSTKKGARFHAPFLLSVFQ